MELKVKAAGRLSCIPRGGLQVIPTLQGGKLPSLRVKAGHWAVKGERDSAEENEKPELGEARGLEPSVLLKG